MSKVGEVLSVETLLSVTIESYGVVIKLESNDEGVLKQLFDAAHKALLGDITIIDNSTGM